MIILIFYQPTNITGEFNNHDIIDSNNGNNNNNTNESNKGSDHHTMERLTRRVIDITNPSGYNGLESSIILMKDITKQNKMRIRGEVNSIDFQDKISTNVVTTLKIINAPGTEISNLDLENITIELINSPNSKIVNNRIYNLYFDSDLSAISVLNSSNTIIMNNIIEENKISDGIMIGIKVNNSVGVEIKNNTIDGLISETVINASSLSLGIVISNSAFINVTANQITNIYGASTSAIVVERGKNNRIAFNNISEITTYSVDKSESFGILLVNTSDNIIEFNKLRNIFSNNFKARSFAFGISLTTVNTTLVNSNDISTVEAVADRPDSFGIHVSSSVQISVVANNIDNIYTKSDIENRAFSTGIYMSHSQILEIKLNKIKNIITEGRASYGVYVDDSNLLEISENVIYSLKSVFKYQNNAEAIIIRKVNNIFISKNFISEITSLAINVDNNLQIPVAIGVLLDNVINSTIENNILNDISSTGNGIPTDSIGILIASNQNVNVKFNTLTQIYSDGFDSFSIGIISQGSSKLNINSNTIDKINSGSNSILLYQAFSVNILVNNNSLYLIGDSDRIFGIYSIKNRNETVQNNNIIANHQTIGISAISLSFSDNFKIYNNKLNDLVNNSIGIKIKSSNNGFIIKNRITNFLLWMQMNDESNSVSCDRNRIDDVIQIECIVGEFNDLVKLENDYQKNVHTESLDKANSIKNDQYDPLKGNSSSKLISLMILPIFLAAGISLIVKRKQIETLLQSN